MIALAVLLVVLASFGFAAGAMLQSTALKKHLGEQTQMTMRHLLRQFTNPRWVLGGVLVLAGAGLHMIALTMAPLAVVQPVGILAIPWTVLASNKLHGYPITKPVTGSIALTIIGVVVFTLLSATHASDEMTIDPAHIAWGGGAIVAAALVLALSGQRGADWWRCLASACGGALLYGLASGFMKIALETLREPGALTNPFLWIIVGCMLACYAIGLFFIQQGYANGPAEIVVGSMTTVDPLIAVIFGLVVLGEGSLITGPVGAGMAVFGVLAIVGVFLLSKYHPDALERNAGRQHKLAAAESTDAV